MAQEKITFYKAWSETTKDLPNDARLEVYDAIVQYAFEGTTIEFGSSLAKVAFAFIKKEIDNESKRQAEISAKRRNAGKQGGAPKNNRNAIRIKEEERQESPISAPAQQVNLFGDVEPVEQKDKPKKPTKPSKHKYAEFVLLSEAEYQKLVDAHGKEGADWMIEKLDNYKAARGMTYKSDYRAILNWVVKEYEKQKLTYGTTAEIRRADATATAPTAKQQRDAEFASHIAKKLTGG